MKATSKACTLSFPLRSNDAAFCIIGFMEPAGFICCSTGCDTIEMMIASDPLELPASPMARRDLASRMGSADSHKTITEPCGNPALLIAETLCQAALHSSDVGDGTDIEPTPHPR